MEKGGTTMSNREKMRTSFSIWFGTFSLGICSGLFGPSLLGIRNHFDTTDVATTVSKLCFNYTLAVVMGAITCGFVFNYVNRQLASAILISVMGIATILLPNLSSSLLLFFSVAFLQLFCWAGYNTSQIVWIIELWKGHAAPYIQIQHFAYSVGCIVSPWFIKPYLDSQNPHLEDNADISLEGSSSSVSNLRVPFLFPGIIMLTSGLFIFHLYQTKPYERPNSILSKPGRHTKSVNRTVLLALSVVFIGFYCAMEGSSFQFLSAFAQYTGLGMTGSQAAAVEDYFSGAFTVGRALGIGLVVLIPVEFLLGANFLVVLAGTLFLVWSKTSLRFLHVTALLLGLGYSTVFGGFFGFIEKHIELGNIQGAFVVALATSTSTFYPLVIQQFIQQSPLVLVYANGFSLCVTVTVFLVIWKMVRKNPVGKPESHQNIT